MKRILVMMLAVVLAMTTLTGCFGGSESDEEKVTDTVNGFFKTYNKGDYEGMKGYLGSRQREILDGSESFVEQLTDVDVNTVVPLAFGAETEVTDWNSLSFKIDRIIVDGESAEAYGTMKIRMSNGAEEAYTMIKLDKEDSGWKIANVNSQAV